MPEGEFAMQYLSVNDQDVTNLSIRLWSGPPSWSVKSIRMNGIDVTDTPLPFGTRDQSLEDVQVAVTDRGARVSGSVIDARGRPVNDYTMIAYAVDRGGWFRNSRFMQFGRADTDGTFKTRGLPPGEYFVVALDWMQGTEGYGEWQDPAFLESLAPKGDARDARRSAKSCR